MKTRAHLAAFDAILPPARGTRDVGLLGRGVDAPVAEVDHAVACLSHLAKSLKLPCSGTHLRLGLLKAQSRV